MEASSAPRNAGGVETAGRLYRGPTLQPVMTIVETAIVTTAIVDACLRQTKKVFMPCLQEKESAARELGPRVRQRQPWNPWWCSCRLGQNDGRDIRPPRKSQE